MTQTLNQLQAIWLKNCESSVRISWLATRCWFVLMILLAVLKQEKLSKHSSKLSLVSKTARLFYSMLKRLLKVRIEHGVNFIEMHTKVFQAEQDVAWLTWLKPFIKMLHKGSLAKYSPLQSLKLKMMKLIHFSEEARILS